MTIAAQLVAGDVLLYHGRGLYGRIIQFHTGHPIGHVECYLGAERSFASRDRIGVNFYDLRTADLTYVCRPRIPFNLTAALAWAVPQIGTPYGWLDLLAFIDVNVDGKGIVCSPAVTLFQRAGTIEPFNGEPANKIAPFQFLTSNVYDIYEVTPDGQVIRRAAEVSGLAS
jgi:hypothetical protein